MKLTFLGTRGNIEARTPRHCRHTSALVGYRGTAVMIDCGKDWIGRLDEVQPDAIVITHAHPDHAFALKATEPKCPVHASREAWTTMERFPVPATLRRTLVPRRPRRIAGIGFEPFPVIHSMRAPAVGYRITAGHVAVFYVPDVLMIEDRKAALHSVRLYIGDGASPVRPIVRTERTAGRPVGHTTIRDQLEWCREQGVPRMIVTHCGTAIVAAHESTIQSSVRSLGAEVGVEVEIAYDGMEKVVR